MLIVRHYTDINLIFLNAVQYKLLLQTVFVLKRCNRAFYGEYR